MLTNKWIITDKQQGDASFRYKYTILYIGLSDNPQKYDIKTNLDFKIGDIVMKKTDYIEPIENLYNAKQTNIAKIKSAICREFSGNNSIKISLFCRDYGIFESIITNPPQSLRPVRGDIITTAVEKNSDDIFTLHFIRNQTQKIQYGYDPRLTRTQDMLILDAAMAGKFDGQTSYKHFLVHSYGMYSVNMPSTYAFFSIQEDDEILVLDHREDNWLEILDNKTLNDLMSKFVANQK